MPEPEADKVTTRDTKIDAFAAALATGHAVESAGRTVGVSPATAYRWAGKAEVIEATQRVRAEVRRRVVDAMATGCTIAVATLIEIARDGESEHARVKASLGLLSSAREWIELDQIAQQVADIEHTLKQARPYSESVRERARLELIVNTEPDA